MLTNIDQGGLRGRNITVGSSLAVIAKQTLQTTLLSPFSCRNNRIWKCVTLVLSTKCTASMYLCSTKYEETAWARHNTFFHNNHYTKSVDKVEV